MGRKQEPGIIYYQVLVNHTQNSKIKLLFNEFGADGYWIWKCLLDKIYEDKGYYIDVSDKDELDLFAADFCKKELHEVEAVIKCCVRRGLFDQNVYKEYQVLTSDRIQETYIEATSERRRKGTIIDVREEYLVIEINPEWNNLIVTRKKAIVPRKNGVNPVNNPIVPSKSIVKDKNSIGEESNHVDKPQVEPKKPTEFWDKFVALWFNFYTEKIGEQPTFDGAAGTSLKSIIKKLQIKASVKKHTWDETYAVRCLTHLLTKAQEHPWVGQNFQLSIINSKFDIIINQEKNGTETPVRNIGPVTKDLTAHKLADRLQAVHTNTKSNQ
jgi:hypothetical protein